MRFVLTSLLAVAGLSSASFGTIVLNAAMTADNAFQASISTSPTDAGTAFLSGDSWPTTFNGTAELPGPGVYYLQVRAQDFGRPEMFIGQFSLTPSQGASFSNGTVSLLTNATDWVVSNTGFGQDTVAPLDIAANNTPGTAWGQRPGIAPEARFLWAPTYTSTVYFTTVITVIPAPSAAALLACAGLAAARRRR